MDTVFKERISAILPASGVLAIVPGLTPQHTIADVFCGVAINIEHPLASGDWITVTDQVEVRSSKSIAAQLGSKHRPMT